jgi:nucleoside-diphosphate-sugar epimerase
MVSKSVLVTGAFGRIGSQLVEPLVMAGYMVWTPTRTILDLTSTGSTDEFFAEYGPFDVIIHAAADGCKDVTDPDESIYRNNIRMMENLLSNKDSWSQLINLGSGAEFDASRPITNFRELEVWNSHPELPYARSKNHINRRLRFFDIENPDKRITTLRIFAVIDESQRIFEKLKACKESGERVVIYDDRYFDYLGLDDLGLIIKHLIDMPEPPIDVNAVYNRKYLISEVAKLYDADLVFDIHTTGENNYTGNSDVLDSLNLPLLGLEASVRKLYE